jgi:hypothetical protein
MRIIIKLIAALGLGVTSLSLQAHEGHATVGSLAHSIEHAGWLAAALMLVSILIVVGFSVSAKWADRVLKARAAITQKAS